MVARSASAEATEPGPVEFDELSDHPFPAEKLGHREHEVGGSGSFRQPALEPESDDLRDQHRDGLTQHRRLRLDPADTPAEHTQAVDHRRMRIGPDQRIGVGLRQVARVGVRILVTGENHSRQIFEIDLVDDAGVRWDHPEVVERVLSPAKELIALPVALIVEVNVGRTPAEYRKRPPAPNGRPRARPAATG